MEQYSHLINHGASTSLLTAAMAITRIAGWGDLPAGKRRDLASALRSVARLHGLPPDAAILAPAALRGGMLTLSAAAAGIGLGTMRNIRSRLKFVLRRLDIIDQKPSLSPAWITPLAPLDHRQRASVIALAGYCSAHGVAPEAVDARVMTGFRDWLEQRTLTPNPTRLAGNTRGARNRLATSVAGWPGQRIDLMPDPRQFILPLDRFTPAFRQAVAAFEADLQRSILTDPLGDVAEDDDADDDTGEAMPPSRLRKPLRPSSARGRADHARWAASALVATGFPLEDICMLADLVRPLANARAIMTFLYERAGRNRSSQGTHIGGVLRMIAKYVVNSPPQEVETISRWAALVGLYYNGMTEKNQRAVSAALRPDHDAKLLALPGALLAAAERLIDTSPRQAACLAWRAAALAFLIRVPLREANIIGLRLDRHLQCDDPRRPVLHAIHIPAEETKTGAPLMRPIPAALDQVLQHWITRFRPLIAAPGNPYLFPAFDRGDGHINRQGFRAAISEVTHRHVGVRLSPHQFRHLAGKRMLTAHPGEYESARQLLGHSRLETTVKHYTGTEMEVTAARFDALITAVPQRKPKTRPKHPAAAMAEKQNARPRDSQRNKDQHDNDQHGTPKAGRRRPRRDPEGSR